MASDRSSRSAEAPALAALALLAVALTISPITNNDLFLHLKTGALVLEGGSVPRVDDYSALARGRPYVAHEWLAAVAFRVVERAFGLDAVILFKALVAALVAACLYAAARTQGAEPLLIMPGLALALVLAAARFLERPHIFTYLMTALFLWLLARRAAGKRLSLWVFVPAQVVWANLHGGFLLGPGVAALASCGAFLDGVLFGLAPEARRAGGAGAARALFGEGARLAALAVALLAACLVNPYGATLLRFPFELTGTSFMGQIYEWQPPFSSLFASTYMARYYVVWIATGASVLLAAGAVAMRRGAPPPGGSFSVLLFAAFLALSLRMNRNVTDFALATVPGVTAAASWLAPGRRDRAWRRSLLPAMVVVLLALAGWFTTRGYAYSPSNRRPFGLGIGRNIPVAAADYLAANGVKGNAFNTYAYGAYLVYRFYPEVRVAMDSRNDVYGEDLYAFYNRALVDRVALAEMLRRIDAAVLFLEWTREGAPLTSEAVRGLGGWSLVYFDDETTVYLRDDGPWAATARRDRYALLDPALFRPGALAAEGAPAALREATRAADGRGVSYMARVMKVDALLALGREREAAAEEAGILSEDPRLHHIYSYLGLVRLNRGFRREAAFLFRRALDLNPASAAARQGLQAAGGSS